MLKSCPLYFFIRIIIVLIVSQGAYKLKYEDNTYARGCDGFVYLTYLVEAQRTKNCHLYSQFCALYVVRICMYSQ